MTIKNIKKPKKPTLIKLMSLEPTLIMIMIIIIIITITIKTYHMIYIYIF